MVRETQSKDKSQDRDIHKYLNTILLPLVGFLLWNKIEGIEKDINDLKSEFEKQRSEQVKYNQMTKELWNKQPNSEKIHRLDLVATIPDEQKITR